MEIMKMLKDMWFAVLIVLLLTLLGLVVALPFALDITSLIVLAIVFLALEKIFGFNIEGAPSPVIGLVVLAVLSWFLPLSWMVLAGLLVVFCLSWLLE